jgi:DNA-binding XRE family transcriptional regulator
MDNLPKLIRQVRGADSQERFAEVLSVSRQTVISWESGRFRPSDKLLRKMGIKVDYKPKVSA